MEKTAILEQCNGGYCVHLGKSFQTHTLCVCKIWLRYSRLQSFPHPATSPPRQRCSRQAGCLVQLAASTRQCQVTGTYAAKVQKYYNDLFLNPLARKKFQNSFFRKNSTTTNALDVFKRRIIISFFQHLLHHRVSRSNVLELSKVSVAQIDVCNRR